MNPIEAVQETALRAAFAPIRPFVKKFIVKRQLVLEQGEDGGLYVRVGIQDDKKPGRAVGIVHFTGYLKEIAERYIFEAEREPIEAEEEAEDDDQEGTPQ